MKSTREMIEVMEAYERGEEIEVRLNSEGSDWTAADPAIWNWAQFDYRIKPKPQYRPWKPEEVPVGALLLLQSGDVSMILRRSLDTCYINDGLDGVADYTTEELLDCGILHSTDGGKTWSPCGVKE